MLDVKDVIFWREEEKKKKKKKSLDKPYIYQARQNSFYQLDHEQFPMQIRGLIHIIPETESIIIQDEDCPTIQPVHTMVEELTGCPLRKDALVILSKKWNPPKKPKRKRKDVNTQTPRPKKAKGRRSGSGSQLLCWGTEESDSRSGSSSGDS